MQINIRRSILAVVVALTTGVAELAAAEPDNLVRDADLTGFASNESRHWQSMQHAGDTSYRFSVDSGELTIERVGKEPWGLIAQQIDVASLRGKQVKASIELAGNFKEMQAPAFEPSGLSIRVQGLVMPGVPAMGLTTVIDKTAEIAFEVGDSDWERYELTALIPEDAQTMEISVRMTYDGKLMARNPAVVVLTDKSEVGGSETMN